MEERIAIKRPGLPPATNGHQAWWSRDNRRLDSDFAAPVSSPFLWPDHTTRRQRGVGEMEAHEWSHMSLRCRKPEGRESKAMDNSRRNGYLLDRVIVTQRDDPARVPWGAPTTIKNERQCIQCKKSFWAWDTGRRSCYLCDPPDPAETQRILEGIGIPLPKVVASKGNGANGNGANGNGANGNGANGRNGVY